MNHRYLCLAACRTIRTVLVFQNLTYRETIVVFDFCFNDISQAKKKNNTNDSEIDMRLCTLADLRRIADLAFNYSAYLITLHARHNPKRKLIKFNNM